MADVKFSEIASGGAIAAATDQILAVRSGSTDILGTVTTIVTKTAPTGDVVGTSDSQTLTNKTISGASNTITAISLSSQVTGTLPVANGGTGITSGTSGGVPYYSANGTIASSGALTANAIIKGGGAGSAPAASGVTLGSSNEIDGYKGSFSKDTSTAYTLVSTDTGKIVELNNAGGITLTVPNSLGTGFCCTITQMGAGQVTISPEAGATVRQRSSYTKIAGQYGVMTMYVTSNTTGTAATYVLAGDGST